MAETPAEVGDEVVAETDMDSLLTQTKYPGCRPLQPLDMELSVVLERPQYDQEVGCVLRIPRIELLKRIVHEPILDGVAGIVALH